MAYLSCIELKPASRELSSLAQLALGDPYREHQLVWRFFPHLEGQRGRRPQAPASVIPSMRSVGVLTA